MPCCCGLRCASVVKCLTADEFAESNNSHKAEAAVCMCEKAALPHMGLTDAMHAGLGQWPEEVLVRSARRFSSDQGRSGAAGRQSEEAELHPGHQLSGWGEQAADWACRQLLSYCQHLIQPHGTVQRHHLVSALPCTRQLPLLKHMPSSVQCCPTCLACKSLQLGGPYIIVLRQRLSAPGDLRVEPSRSIAQIFSVAACTVLQGNSYHQQVPLVHQPCMS